MNGLRTDLNKAQWAILAPLLPAAKHGGRPRATSLRGVLDAVSCLLRTGCQWRLLPARFPPWVAAHHSSRPWQRTGVWVRLHRAVCALARAAAGRPPCPSLVVMDGRSVKATEYDGVRGFDGPEPVRGRKRSILVDAPGLPIASRVEPANMPDRKAGARLLAGLRSLFPAIRTAMADAGYQSRRLARAPRQHRNQVERLWARLNEWRAVATRYGKTARSFMGVLCLKVALDWLRD